MSDLDQLQIQISADSSKATSKIDMLTTKLGMLATNLSNLGASTSGMDAFSSSVEKLGTSMKIFKDSGVSGQTFNSLAKSIGKLGNVDSASIMRSSNAMIQMSSALGKLTNLQGATTQLKDLATSIGILGSKKVQNAVTNMPQLATSLNDLMNTLSKAPNVSQNLIDMTNALANLSSQGAKVGTVTNSITKTQKESVPVTKNVNSGLRSMHKNFKGLASSIGMFYAKFFLVIRAMKKLGTSVKSTMDYIEAFNFFDVASKNAVAKNWQELGYESADAYLESFETRLTELNKKMSGLDVDYLTGDFKVSPMANLGINLTELTTFESEIVSITSSLGLMSETALNTSKAMTMLAADMSSLHNVDLQTVFKNLQSGLIGQSRAMYKYGIDITSATLSQYALANGITKSVSEMSQSEKMQLRLLAIFQQLNGGMAQSQNAWGDLARTMEQPANQLRRLQNGFKNLGTIIGKLFLPIVETTLPYLNAMVIVLQRLAESIAHFFGITLDGSSGATATGDYFEDLEEGAEDATDAVSKLNKQLAPFDKLNNLTTSNKASKGDIEGMIDLSSQIADALANYEKVWNEAFNKIEDKATIMAQKVVDAFNRVKRLFGKGFFSTFNVSAIESAEKAFKNLKSAINLTFGQDTKSKLKDFADKMIETGGSIYGSLTTSVLNVFTGITDSIANATRELSNFNSSKISSITTSFSNLLDYVKGIAEYVQTISEVFNSDAFKGIATTLEKIGNVVVMNTIDAIVGTLKDLFGLITKPITDNKDSIKNVLQNMLDIANYLLTPLKELGNIISKHTMEWEDTWLHKLLSALTEAASTLLGKRLESINEKLEKIKNVLGGVVGFWEKIKTKAVELGVTVKNSELVTNLKNNWESLKTSSIMLKASLATKFEDIKSDLQNLINGIKKFINTHLIQPLNDKFKISIPSNAVTKFLKIDGYSGQVFKLNELPTYQTGGFPEDGLFMANHNELVGQFANGKTAVANNQQITDGIEEAAYRGFMRAMSQSGGNTNVNVVLEGDARGVFNVVRTEARNYERRNGTPAFGY